ncbi:MAG: DUF4079 domain-containing protein [Cyanobacteria bacterium J06648_11]
MPTVDLLRMLHPMLASVFVMPLIGIATYFAFQTRQRRLKTAAGEKSKIPPVVGKEHVQIGRVLTASVVGLAMIGLTHPIVKTIIKNDVLVDNPMQVFFIGLMYVFTIATLVFLYQAKQALWRGVFGTLSGMGLVILGCQDGVFRRGYEWYLSHYYFGMAAALLMIFSLAILPDIYKSKTWRQVHILCNCFALLLFVSQGLTGVRDLLEIPLSWQEPFVFSCDFANKTCS